MSRPPGHRAAMCKPLVSWGFALPLLAFVAGRCLVPMDETDLFYNLRLGEIVLTTQSVPRVNLLSFTYPDHPDPNLAWLFQVVLALAHRWGGVPATVLLKTVFVVATFALLYRVALRRGAHPALAAAALALAAWAAEPRFVERPHLVTFLGLATLLLALERAEAKRPALLWALIPLGLVWANGNSCFFLAPAVLLLYALGTSVDGGGGNTADRSAALKAAVVAVALVPLLFATPSGAGWIGYVANHFRMPSLRPLQEYRTAEWPVDGPFIFLLAAVTLVTVLPFRRGADQLFRASFKLFFKFSFKSSIHPPPRQPEEPAPRDDAPPRLARHLLPILALAVLGSRRIRFVAEFSLLAGPFVAARATPLLRQLRPPPRLADAGAGLVALVLMVLTLVPRVRGDGAFHLNVEEGLVPRAAIRFIDDHQLRGRLYNDLEVGSYLTWDGWPRARVFQDPRINAYPAPMHALLRREDLNVDDWEGLMSRHGIDSALITYPDVNPRAALFPPHLWALVYRTNEALVFVRRNAARAALILAEELPLTFRFHARTGVEVVALDRPPAGSPFRDCEWQRRLADWHLAQGDTARASAAYRLALTEEGQCLAPRARESARERAAGLALRTGEPERAISLLDGLPSLNAASNRGFALVQAGRPGDALREFDDIIRQSRDNPESQFGRAVALVHLGRDAEGVRALRTFLDRWPRHFAAGEAAKLLARLPVPKN